MVQVVLEDHRGGDRIELPALAQATHVAFLVARDSFGFLGTETLVPHLDRDAQYALRHARKILSATGLAAVRAIGVQRQTNHYVGDTLALRKVDERIENGG